MTDLEIMRQMLDRAEIPSDEEVIKPYVEKFPATRRLSTGETETFFEKRLITEGAGNVILDIVLGGVKLHFSPQGKLLDIVGEDR